MSSARVIFTFFSYFFGNAVWNPATGAITGMPDAILAWFYGHSIVGLFLTPLAVAAGLLHHSDRQPGPRSTATPCPWSASGPSS